MADPRRVSLVASVPAGADFATLAQAVRLAEDAGFDAVLLRGPADAGPDSTTLAAALGAVTTRIGLLATMGTTDQEPYNAARRFASLDHLTQGRIGWQITESGSTSRDAEFLAIVMGLWDSWEEGALLRDKASGVYMDRERVHFLDHAGAAFKVRGPLNVARTPQGRPIMAYAPASDAGRNIAAATADIVFTADGGLEAARTMKARAAAAGRLPGDLMVMPSLAAAHWAAFEASVSAGVADGFDVMFDGIEPLEAFCRVAMPELRARGVVQAPGAPGTLRQRLDLPVPENRYTAARRSVSR